MHDDLSIREINTEARWVPYVRAEQKVIDALANLFRVLDQVGVDRDVIAQLENKYGLMNHQLETIYARALGEDR